MDDREKAELNKQKKLVDCVSQLNSVLEAFARLENYQARVLPIIDGFDLTHPDTYLELTENIRRELFYIKFFSEHAASQLVKYRRLCYPDQDIYSIKEKKNREKYGLKPLGDWKKQSEETQRILNESQKKIDEMLEKRKKENIDEVKFKDLKDSMEAGGIKQENLVGVIGSRGVVSEVVNGKRSISKAQAKALAEFFSVNVGLFI